MKTILILTFIISTIILYREVRKYYKTEREMARTNDMYISHTSLLSTTGINCIIISLSSIITLFLLYIYELKLS